MAFGGYLQRISKRQHQFIFVLDQNAELHRLAERGPRPGSLEINWINVSISFIYIICNKQLHIINLNIQLAKFPAPSNATMEGNFSYVRIKGEISQPKLHTSGHLYLSLKDEGAKLDAVCWKGNVSKLKIKPEEGLEVIATGKISTFGGQSKYQLIIESMEVAGVGALMALLEKRKKELAAKGLFAAERKRALPFMPTRIGVVTSPTGAVIRDILHRIEERFPSHVLVWPVRVQGQGAHLEIAEAIKGFNALPENLPAASFDCGAGRRFIGRFVVLQ